MKDLDVYMTIIDVVSGSFGRTAKWPEGGNCCGCKQALGGMEVRATMELLSNMGPIANK